MGYVQKNNPFQKTSCGRRRNYMMIDNGSSPLQKNKLPKKEEDISVNKDVLE